MIEAILANIAKDFRIEFRRRFAVNIALSFAAITTLAVSLTAGGARLETRTHALLFWIMGRRYKAAEGRGEECHEGGFPARKQDDGHERGHRLWVEGCEPICAGLISGSALVGIGNAIINVLI